MCLNTRAASSHRRFDRTPERYGSGIAAVSGRSRSLHNWGWQDERAHCSRGSACCLNEVYYEFVRRDTSDIQPEQMLQPRNLRVALVAGTLDRGGAEKQLFYMARALVRAGVDVRVCCLQRGEVFETE